MSEYFGKVPDPRALLDRERAPISGRRVHKDQAKRHGGTTPQRGRPRWVLVAAAAAVLTVVGGAIAIAAGDHSPAPAASATTATEAPTATSVDTTTAPEATAAPSTAISAGAAVTTSTEPAPTATGLAAVVPTSFRLVADATTSQPVITRLRDHPSYELTVAEPPVYRFVFNCDASGCRFSLRDWRPGEVTADGSTSIAVVDGHVSYTDSSPYSCASGGTAPETDTIDLILSGTQVVNGVSVPTTIQGTHSSTFPELGNFSGLSRGCPGFTSVTAINGLLTPG